MGDLQVAEEERTHTWRADSREAPGEQREARKGAPGTQAPSEALPSHPPHSAKAGEIFFFFFLEQVFLSESLSR